MAKVIFTAEQLKSVYGTPQAQTTQPVEQPKESVVSNVASKLQNAPGVIGSISRAVTGADKISGGKMSSKLEQYGSDVAGQFKKAGERITQGVQQGAEQIQQGNILGGIKTAGLRTAGTVAGAAFAPITEIPAVKKATESIATSVMDKPEVQSIAEKLSSITQKYPELAQDATDILNLATLGGGKAVEKPLADIVETTTAKVAKKLTPKPSNNKSINLVASTEDTLTKSERQAAIDEGRAVVTKLGKTEYLPTKTEIRAGEILAGKLKSNPVKNVPVIKQEIKTRGASAEKYLETNKKPITAEQQANMFKETRDKMAKYSTDTELKAYDEQLKMFTKLIPGKGGFNTANFYKALKEYENNIANKLARGKEALLDPTGAASAKLQAAKDIRKTVRDTIGSMHEDFQPQMFDIASLYDALDNTIIKAEKTSGNILQRTAKKYPTATKVIGGAAAGAIGVKALTQ